MRILSLKSNMAVRTIAVTAALALIAPPCGWSQPVLLDNFDTLAGWRAIVSDGAKLTIGQSPGKAGGAMVMDFDLRGVYGYVIAEKDFPIELPPDYQFTFDMRADAQVNNFEFKVIDDRENVYWIKKLNVEYPREWTKQRIKKRHLSFAWGPASGKPLQSVRKIQFVVSCGTGGTGKVFIDNFRFEPIDTSAAGGAVAELVGRAHGGTIDARGNVLQNWQVAGEGVRDSLVVNFHRIRELGGLVVDWDGNDYAESYDVLLSDDGHEWTRAYEVVRGKPGRAYIPLTDGEGSQIKLVFRTSSRGKGYAIHRMEFKGPEFSSSLNAFYRALAADAPPGSFPKYFQNKQSYWTVVGVDGDPKEALLNEQGQVEVDKLQFSIEPFLMEKGKFITWSDVRTDPWLLEGYIPFPSTTWHYGDGLELNVQAMAVGYSGNSMLLLHYAVYCESGSFDGKLYLAFRPFQVVPPWQQLNAEGGASRIDSIAYRRGVVRVNEKTVVPMSVPGGFGAAQFDEGDVTEFLRRGELPPSQDVVDPAGRASGALVYPVKIGYHEEADIYLAVPFQKGGGSPPPNMLPNDAQLYCDLAMRTEAERWHQKLGTIQLDLPGPAKAVENTFRTTLAYILINRDGPAIQPGSRTYERSWIRDGALTCSALLRVGHTKEVREFLDWYAKNQFPDGKIPCVVDTRGPDAVPEHDSNGEFIYAVLQYYLFTKDTTWLRGKFEAVVKTVRYLQSLRAQRKTDVYRNGTPLQRAEFGILPESISHEGYWDVPRHSYWDDFFALRGFKDATTIAGILGERTLEKEFAAERDDFRSDLYASMRLAMKNTKVNYIPGCAELGDFDATSTTIGVQPGGELGHIPEPELHNTFDKYYRYFVNRKTNDSIVNYTPYEMRVIGTFVMLGQKQRAEDALNFFMRDRRPAAWNEWAEVVWRNPDAPKYIGDMPHTWVGSDFMRSVLTMFIYERERDTTVVLAAGIPDAWVADSAGVKVGGLWTYDGILGYSLKQKGDTVTARVAGNLSADHRLLVMTSPLTRKLRSVRVNGKSVRVPSSGEVPLRVLPATIDFVYRKGSR